MLALILTFLLMWAVVAIFEAFKSKKQVVEDEDEDVIRISRAQYEVLIKSLTQTPEEEFEERVAEEIEEMTRTC